MVGAEAVQARLQLVRDRTARRDSDAPACRPGRRSGCRSAVCQTRPHFVASTTSSRRPAMRLADDLLCPAEAVGRARCRSASRLRRAMRGSPSTDASSSVPPHIQPPIAQVPRPTARRLDAARPDLALKLHRYSPPCFPRPPWPSASSVTSSPAARPRKHGDDRRHLSVARRDADLPRHRASSSGVSATRQAFELIVAGPAIAVDQMGEKFALRAGALERCRGPLAGSR